MPFKRLKNANGYLRRGGFHELGLRLSARKLLPDWMFLMNETEIVELTRLNTKALERALTGYECACADESAIEGLLTCSPPMSRPILQKAFKRFFEERARCYVVRRNADVVGYVWAFPHQYVLTFDDYRGRNLTIQSSNNSVFLGNGMIDEKHRLKGLFPPLMAFVVKQWPDGTHFYSAVDRVNELSLLSHYRLGFVPRCKVLCLTFLGINCFFRRKPEDFRWIFLRPHKSLVVPPRDAGPGVET